MRRRILGALEARVSNGRCVRTLLQPIDVEGDGLCSPDALRGAARGQCPQPQYLDLKVPFQFESGVETSLSLAL